MGRETYISPTACIGENVSIGPGCYIDHGAILKDNVTLGEGSYVGCGCVLGEYLSDFLSEHTPQAHPLSIGSHAVIRGGTVIYGGTEIGDYLQTGHYATIREHNAIGSHVSIGSMSEVQHQCSIADYVRIHSKVFVGELTELCSFVWLFPYVVLTNDPTPPSHNLQGITVESFACICARSVVLPGVQVAEDTLVGAGSVLTKSTEAAHVYVGNPARDRGHISQIKNPQTGEPVYPWRYTFSSGMPWDATGYDAWVRQREGALGKLSK